MWPFWIFIYLSHHRIKKIHQCDLRFCSLGRWRLDHPHCLVPENATQKLVARIMWSRLISYDCLQASVIFQRDCTKKKSGYQVGMSWNVLKGTLNPIHQKIIYYISLREVLRWPIALHFRPSCVNNLYIWLLWNHWSDFDDHLVVVHNLYLLRVRGMGPNEVG